MTEKKSMNWVKGLSQAVNLATTIAAAVAFCGLGGNYLDKKLGTGPWLTILGVFLGIATAMKVLWDAMQKTK